VKREELEHVIRAAADVVDDQIVVTGSQAILAEHPNAPASLLRSVEVDVYPLTHPERADEIDGAIGDGSRFHETYEYYAHGVGPETAVAPAGWRERMLRLELPPIRRTRGNVVAWCMAPHDVVLAKLAEGRPHDIEFAVAAVREGIVDPEQLELGAELMPASHRELTRERLAHVLARASA
jgi:hypothetical protein